MEEESEQMKLDIFTGELEASTKECIKCGEILEVSRDNFHRNGLSKDGFAGQCKECKLSYIKKYREDNPDTNGAYSGEYYLSKSASSKNFVRDNPGATKVCTQCGKSKLISRSNFPKQGLSPDGFDSKCKGCKNSNKRAFRDKDRTKYDKNAREYYRKYYRGNKESERKRSNEYQRNNPEVGRMSGQRRRARKALLPHTLTETEWELSLEYFNQGCSYCGTTEGTLDQEHVIPLSKGGGYVAENIIPSCRSCNSSKHARSLLDWYPKQPTYTADRLTRILSYIELSTP